MKKIVAAFDGFRLSNSTMQHSIALAKLTGAHLVGVFLEDFTYTNYKIYDLVNAEGGLVGSARKKFQRLDSKTRAKSIKLFESTCLAHGIEFTCHRDRSVAIQELLHESIYADLLVIDVSETLSHHPEEIPTEFVRDLLCNAQCPVMIVPPDYSPFDKLSLLYDGSPSSVHAIKMLSYTLSELKQLPVEVISVKSQKQTRNLPDGTLMKEFMYRHFPEAEYTVVKGVAEPEIIAQLKSRKGNPLVVLGAYRRSTVSRWFHQSLADVLMKKLKMPLLVAHNK